MYIADANVVSIEEYPRYTVSNRYALRQSLICLYDIYTTLNSGGQASEDSQCDSFFFQWEHLLADIGGTLGLFVGVSVCTVLEFVEFLVKIAAVGICRMKAGKKANVTPIVDH